ncbi:putative Rho termination factor [Lupinus albus]|uniref:Putative Rho termination factor n=1 Tax=Lupinus albus TaxID=3870 RepID=A0A6A4N5N1_LUPAL|nr:putative Rho termination factor [Lupinus albus]
MLTESEEVRNQLISIGAMGRKMYLSSRLSASQFANYDLVRNKCDHARKPARRACKKGSKVAPAEDLDSMELALQVVYPQELCLADTELCSFGGSHGDKSQDARLIHAENSALISLLKKPTQSALFPGLQLIDEEKQPPQGVKSKIVAKKSNMSFPSKLKSQGKRKADSEAFSAREAYDSPTEVDPNTCIVVSTKRKQTSTGTSSLNESVNRKITKRAVQPCPDGTECRAIVPYITEAHDNPTEADPNTLLVASTKRGWKSITSSGTASLNESMNGNITKRAVQPGPDGSECCAIVPYISEAHDNPTEVDPSKMLIVSTNRQWKSKTSIGTTSLNETMNSNINKSAVHPGLDGTEGRAIVPYISEAHDSPTKVDPCTSIVASTKRQCKSETSTGTANLNEPMSRKITKRAELGWDATESRSVVPYNSEFSELQKRRLSKWPITAEIQNSTVNLDSPNPDRVSMCNGSQVDLHIVESYSLEDSHNETTASQLITLKKLNLPALRAMAKQYDLKKYYKLRKAELLQQLVERMSNC